MSEVRKIRVLIADDHALVRSGLRPVGELELAEDVRDMRFHRALADPQRGGDLLVRTAARDELQDFTLARGQIAVALVFPGRTIAAA